MFEVGLLILQNNSCNLTLGSITKSIALVPLLPSFAACPFMCPSLTPSASRTSQGHWTRKRHAGGTADRSCVRASSEPIFTAELAGTSGEIAHGNNRI